MYMPTVESVPYLSLLYLNIHIFLDHNKVKVKSTNSEDFTI